MKKVTTINLNGRAYQAEEEGYETLKAYLDRAEKTLANNPDKTEILMDIEQAIADKCEAELTGGKNVVSSAGVDRVLDKIGPVHEFDSETEGNKENPAAESPRKLYRLNKEGKISGVCAGLAAYFGTDVTIMRLIFVLLLFVTQGFMIVIYIALTLAMPEAKTPEQVAEAHGKPGTAKQIMGRVKDATTDADTVSKVGNIITLVGGVIATALKYVSAGIFGLFTIIWLWIMTAVGLGSLNLQGELATLNGWKQIVFVTAVYVVVALPLLLFVRAIDRIGKRQQSDQSKSAVFDISAVAIITISAVVISAFFSLYASSVSDYVKTHGGYLDIGSHQVCVDENRCGDAVRQPSYNPEFRRFLDNNGQPNRG